MILYLITVLVLQVLGAGAREDCWVRGRMLDYDHGPAGGRGDANSFEECKSVCKEALGADCYYVMYTPNTSTCDYDQEDGNVIEHIWQMGYLYSSRECSKMPVAARSECRVQAAVAALYSDLASSKGLLGTVAECDEFCLSFDWCKAFTWHGGENSTPETVGFCQPSESTIIQMLYTADMECLESGDPCSDGKVLDRDFGCVEGQSEPEATAAPVDRLITLTAQSNSVSCKEGKKCIIRFILSPGVVIKRINIRVCKKTGDGYKDCKEIRKRKNVVALKLKGDDIAGEYICYVDVDGEKVLSDVTSVSVN